MAISTVEGLQEALERELAWRKKEISGLRVSAMRSDAARSYLFRAGLILLCAHWEGFLRRSVELYRDHVFSQGLAVRNLSPVFVAVAYYGDVRRAAEATYPGSREHHLRLAARILEGIDVACSRPTWEVRTEANPGTDVLTRLLSSVGLDPSLGLDTATWSATRVFIDEKVVRDRNLVAHGEGFRLDRDEFLERASRMTELIDKLCANVMDAAERRAYHAS